MLHGEFVIKTKGLRCYKSNYITKFTPLLWSRFRYIKSDLSECFLGVDVTVKTRTLTTPHLSDSRLYRLRLIDNLHRKGLNNRDIVDYLNQRETLSPCGGSYSPKLVWVTHKKFLRNKRVYGYFLLAFADPSLPPLFFDWAVTVQT